MTRRQLSCRPAQLRTGSSVRSQQAGAASSASDAAAAAVAAVVRPSPAAACLFPAAAQPPAETVETRLPLPALDFAEPLLSVTTELPPSATAGQPFRCDNLQRPASCIDLRLRGSSRATRVLLLALALAEPLLSVTTEVPPSATAAQSLSQSCRSVSCCRNAFHVFSLVIVISSGRCAGLMKIG